jgi:hypothetical protein
MRGEERLMVQFDFGIVVNVIAITSTTIVNIIKYRPLNVVI